MELRQFLATAFLGAAVSATAAVPVSAHDRDRYVGSGRLYDFTEPCFDSGFRGSLDYEVAFEPAGLGRNGTISNLYFLSASHILVFSLANGRIDSTWQETTTLNDLTGILREDTSA